MINPDLPLTDLHRHLDGNIKAKRIWQLMQQHGLTGRFRHLEDVENALHMHTPAPDLMGFLKKLDLGVSVLVNTDAIRQVAQDNVADAWQEGLDYAELRFSPVYMAQTHNLALHSVIEAVWDGVQEGMRQHPVKINLIGILSRTNGAQRCMDELNAILTYPDYFVALDLAGDEKNAPAKWFEEHFRIARDAGLQATVHAGEADGPQSIWDAIELLHARRIGHGVHAIKDAKLMDAIREKGVVIESCPTSNLHTNTVDNWAAHPLKAFVEKGLSVTLNTDDPGVSNITLADEYQVAKHELGLSTEQLDAVQLNGLKGAFLSGPEQEALLQKKKP